MGLTCGTEKEKKSESVINLSETCVERLIKEEKESGKKTVAEEFQIPEDVSEKEWIMKLKCLDDAHSNAYGLTIQAFHKLVDQVESQIEPIRPNLCDPSEIIYCLQKNPCCSIKCKAIMDKFIDSVDTSRINIIKEQIECELKEKRREDNEIVEQFLKNENGEFE